MFFKSFEYKINFVNQFVSTHLTMPVGKYQINCIRQTFVIFSSNKIHKNIKIFTVYVTQLFEQCFCCGDFVQITSGKFVFQSLNLVKT